MKNIAVIGCGSRMSSVLRELEQHEDMRISAIADPRIEELKEQFAGQDIRFYPDADSMLNNEQPDGVMIGTRCSLHTPMALKVLERGLPLFLEKPVATSYEQLEALKAMTAYSDRVVVSFPLRLSRIVERVREIIDSGTLGTVEHVQAYNNVPYGRGYYHKWYRDEGETGGLFLQKSTHDFDYINYLLGDRRPVAVCAMNSKQIYRGDMPAGLKCADCARKDECPEYPPKVVALGDRDPGEWCCFAVDTGNEDSGSAIVRYDTGMHVVYTQNFVARKGAGKRGARLIGYRGTLEFDFRTSTITVFPHDGSETIHETITFQGSGHHGGDYRLMKNFTDVVRGTDISHATLAEGILSAEMCLAARESAQTDRFVKIRGL